MSAARDAQGHAVAATSADTAVQLDSAVDAYLGARADTRTQLDALLATDPRCVMAHCLDGYLRMLSSRREGADQALDALRRASRASEHASVSLREELHVAALDAWAHGDMRGAVQQWDSILGAYPRDIVALRVSQFVLSYLGESERMRDTVARALRAWDADTPGYGFVLGCYAYGLEESGDYLRAEELGRRAVDLNPTDIWAAHAVTHVTEMQGRLQDGLTWISTIGGNWDACNNFAFHLRWHEALFELDLERYPRVLELYDREVRRKATDEYLDVTNAVSLLWRLEQGGVDVGSRWRELASCARAHGDDHALVFADLHYIMALAAVDDASAVEQFLDSSERFALSEGTEATVMREVGLPVARAVVAHRRGAFREVVDLLMPVRERFRRIGGSHAQRDLFDQLLIDSAWRSRRLDSATQLLQQRTAQRPRNIWGWKHYATILDATGSSAGAAEAERTLERLRGV